MRELAYTLLVAAVMGCAPAWAQRTGPPASPEVSSNGMATFRLLAPSATDITISGEFLNGAKALKKSADGVWSVTIGPIEPEIYNYNFTIDGVKTIDPGNPQVKTGSTPSTIASILEVKGAEPAFYDEQNVPHGEIRTDFYNSKTLGALRRLTVYTPPDYDRERNMRYPVLYLFHGANADETAWARLGRANFILDNLLAAHKTPPFIVVMPFGYGIAPGTPRMSADGPGSDEMFARDLVGDAIPFIEAKYRVASDRGHRAIFGLSMGGGESLSIGLNHLDLFAYVGGFSAGLRPGDFPKTFAAAAANPQAANQALRLLWIGCGADDGAMVNSKAFDEFLTEHSVKHIFRQSAGAHTWIVWRRYLNEVAPLLFR